MSKYKFCHTCGEYKFSSQVEGKECNDCKTGNIQATYKGKENCVQCKGAYQKLDYYGKCAMCRGEE